MHTSPLRTRLRTSQLVGAALLGALLLGGQSCGNNDSVLDQLDLAGENQADRQLADRIAGAGNPASVSDAGVAGAAALAAAEGAALNVRINLPSLTEAKVADEIRAEMDSLSSRAAELAARVRATVDEVLRSQDA